MAEHVCPVWVGYLLASPLRRLFENPEKLLREHVVDGMTVLDIGCAMGFFSLPLARLVGNEGKVVCVDLQKKMLEVLEKRARKAGLSERIKPRLCTADSLGLKELEGTVDYALASAVVHEVPDPAGFFSEIHDAIKKGGKFLVSEPKGHVSESDFDKTISLSEQKGFTVLNRSKTFGSRIVLLKKNM
jgi:ubiquinone/menaquinone biosynthesis C-methylase UbiE